MYSLDSCLNDETIKIKRTNKIKEALADSYSQSSKKKKNNKKKYQGGWHIGGKESIDNECLQFFFLAIRN